MDKVQALRAKVAQQREEIAALKEYFTDLFPEEYAVSDSQFGVWIRQYGFDYAVTAFEEGAKKLNKTEQEIAESKGVIDKKTGKRVAQPEAFTPIGLVKFLSWVMINERRKAEKA
jgi:hypothetical protein